MENSQKILISRFSCNSDTDTSKFPENLEIYENSHVISQKYIMEQASFAL